MREETTMDENDIRKAINKKYTELEDVSDQRAELFLALKEVLFNNYGVFTTDDEDTVSIKLDINAWRNAYTVLCAVNRYVARGG